MQRLFLALDVHTRVLHTETVDKRSEQWFCFGRMYAVVSCIVNLDMPGKDQHQRRFSPLVCTIHNVMNIVLWCAIFSLHKTVELKIALQRPVCLCCVYSCFMYLFILLKFGCCGCLC